MEDGSTTNLPTLFSPSTCVRKGLCPVTTLRKQDSPVESHSLYFEQHGMGPDKILLIMGLNSTSFSWLCQVEHFAKTHSVLVFDNRGVGYSDSPRGPYTTEGMSQDIVVLLDHIGWTSERELHVVGASLGGMIAQELTLKIPQRIASLTLAVTKAGGIGFMSLTPWKGLSTLTRITFINDDEKKVQMVLNMIYPKEWLDANAVNGPEGRTNSEVMRQVYFERIAVQRPQTLIGSLSQMAAATTHHCTPEKLRKIAESIPKIWILTGDEDNLVYPSNSFWLHKHMPEAKFEQWTCSGHGLIGQYPERFNKRLNEVIQDAKQRIAAGAAL